MLQKLSLGARPPLLLFLRLACLLALFPAVPRITRAEPPSSSPKQGAALVKTDLLGVFAHPDDETGLAATLAYYAQGRKAVVANVYCTRGEGGGNMVGTQAGAALGILREAELRDCLAALGVRYCYFLDQLDWAYTESVSATLRKWGKEQTLEKLVRLVRSLRPEVMVTMNPAPTPGQHGHHQAAGMLATEAFAAAADPHRFPLQLTKDGLAVWQPRKLYYGGGSSGVLATISVTSPLPSGTTPAQVAAQALANHRSQAFGNFGSSPWLQRPQKFTLVRSFAQVAEPETDLLAGLGNVTAGEVHFAQAPPKPPVEVRFAARPAFARYQQWMDDQGLGHLAAQFTADPPLISGEANELPVQLVNHTAASVEGELLLEAPAGWQVEPLRRRVRVAGNRTEPVLFRVTPPIGATNRELSATLITQQGNLAAKAKAHPLPRARVVRVKTAPALDGSSRGWENVPELLIHPADLFQGKVANEADSSAAFRLAHDGRTLFLDVQVKDDVVVTNIAPDDIKGHWRSDSIEVCLDPAGGAEDTMGCYKLGIFPFDMSGVVRAARDADANQGPVEETAPKTRLGSRRTEDGYRIQVAIPFQEFGLDYRKKSRLGFNLIVYDGDKRDAALGENINKSRIAWAPRAGVMGRPEDWGRLDLDRQVR